MCRRELKIGREERGKKNYEAQIWVEEGERRKARRAQDVQLCEEEVKERRRERRHTMDTGRMRKRT